MIITLDTPRSLVREIKPRATHEGCPLKDVFADLLRQGLAQALKPMKRPADVRCVKLPLIQGRKTGTLTPEQVAHFLMT